MKKKLKTIGFGLFAALLIPTSVFASDGAQLGPGEWDPKGSEDLYIYPNCNVNTNTNFNSQGGDFQIRVRNVTPGNSYTISLWEYDPGNADDGPIGGKKRVYGDENVTYDVRGFLDGSDGDAELYVKIESAYADDTVTIYAYD